MEKLHTNKIMIDPVTPAGIVTAVQLATSLINKDHLDSIDIVNNNGDILEEK